MTALSAEDVTQAFCAYMEAVQGKSPSPTTNVFPRDSAALRLGNTTPGTAPYFTVAVLDDVGVGGPVEIIGNPSGDPQLQSQVTQLRQIVVQIDGYGQAALPYLETARTVWIRTTGYPAALRAAGVSVIRAVGPRNMAGFRQTNPEPRWVVTFDAYVDWRDLPIAVDAVSAIVVDVTLDRDGSAVDTFTVTVPTTQEP